MPYSALPSARRRHYEIDGTVAGYNLNGGFGAGLGTLFTSTDLTNLNGETPSVGANVITSFANNVTAYMFWLFAELVDLNYFLSRGSSNGTYSFGNFQSSTDTSTGIDGTWNNVGSTGTLSSSAAGGDWWRSTTPATLTSNNTGIRGIRFTSFGSSNLFHQNVYIWGTKHSGQTADDIIFLESDGTTEWPNDDDWGDVAAGSPAVTHTYYVKNTSGTKTANTITVKASGSDSSKWTVSLDNVSFASSKSISSLAAGATQIVYFKFTPPAGASGVFRPNAAYLEADVTSWT